MRFIVFAVLMTGLSLRLTPGLASGLTKGLKHDLKQQQAMSGAKINMSETYKYTSKKQPQVTFEIPEFKNWKITEQPNGSLYYNPEGLSVKFEIPPSIGFLTEANFNKAKSKELTDWKENPYQIKYKKYFVSGYEAQVINFQNGKKNTYISLPDDHIEYGLDQDLVEKTIVKTLRFVDFKTQTHVYKNKIAFSFDYPIFDLWKIKNISPSVIQYLPDESIPVDLYSPPDISIIFESKLKDYKTKDLSDWKQTKNKVSYKTIFVSGFEKQALVFKNKTDVVIILKTDDVKNYGLDQSIITNTILNSFKFL